MLDAADARVIYTGNGAVDTFAVEDALSNPIYFTSNSHIYARTYNTNTEVFTDLTEGVDYTLTGGPDTGQLVLSAGNLAVGVKLAIWRSEPLDQDSDFGVSSDFSSSTHNNVADRHRRIDQDLRDETTRALKRDVLEIYFDADNLPIRNVADPSGDQDAVTKAYGDANYGGASVTAAAASAAAAATSASNADTSASAASSSASAAAASAAAASADALDWQGAWLTATAYVVADAVSNNGSSYRCKLGHTSGASSEPGSGGSWSTYWDLLASKGTSGAGTGDMAASDYDPANVFEQLVGVTAIQTLTNKTLVTPVLTLEDATGSAPTTDGHIKYDRTGENLEVGTGAGTSIFSNDATNAATYEPLLGYTPLDPASNLSDVGAAATAFDNIKQDATTSATGVVELVTAAEWRSNTANKVLETNEVWSAMAEVTLSDGANISLDLSSGYDFTVTLAGNRTLDNPTNAKVGQRGRIRVVQDGTGSRTLSFGTSYEFIEGTAVVMSSGADDEDLLYYDVISSTRVFISKAGAIA